MQAELFIAQQGWSNHPSGDGSNVVIDTCPLCHNSKGKFYMGVVETNDGLWDCKACSESGNLFQLKSKVGITTDGVTSLKDAASSSSKPSPLPNLLLMHRRLMTDPNMGDIMDYLVCDRKWSLDVIEKMQIGGDVSADDRWVIIPYLDSSNSPVFFKGRSLPKEGERKKFRAPGGREACLYNERIIRPGMDHLVMCEGEADCLSLMSQGFEDVVGVPGASVKKATWISQIDEAAPKVVYLCFDNDKAGQEHVKDLAQRIGLDRVRNIILPMFVKEDGTPGKDLNEYFCAGYTLSDFSELMASAKMFPVAGIQSVGDILMELQDDLENNGNQPKFDTPWHELTKKVGGFEEGDLVGILAAEKIGKTTLAMNMLQYYAAKHGHPGFLFCQEMMPKRQVRKWVSHVTQTDDTPGRSLITTATVKASMELAKGMAGDLLFGFNPGCKAEEVFETIRQAQRRYGVKVACFDNLQMMVKSLQHAPQETSTYTKAFKQIAMELKILMLLIIQPHRVAEDVIVGAQNAMGSSAIGKDVDFMICAHRNKVGNMKAHDFTGYVETEEAYEPHMLINVDLARFAPGGKCTLLFDGCTSTVRSFSEELPKHESIPAVNV